MPRIGRRTFLSGSAAAGILHATPRPVVPHTQVDRPRPVWALGGLRRSSVHEAAARDAAMVWHRLPADWREAPFLGNGSLTAQLYAVPGDGGLTFTIGSAGSPWECPRATAHLGLTGAPTGVRVRLDLWQAELSAAVTTTGGEVSLAALVHRQHDVLLVCISGGVAATTGWWLAGPEPMAWRERRIGSRVLVAVGPAVADVERALAADLDELVDAHRRWWSAFFGKSFVSVPDRTLQRFAWAQLYTAAATTRPGTAVAGCASALLNGTNHLEIGTGGDADPAWALHHLAAVIPGTGSKAGGADSPVAAWRLPEIWARYRHSMDVELLRDVLYPRLRRAVDHYVDFLDEQADGRLHLPLVHVPGGWAAADSTYHLSLLRWAATALVSAAPLAAPDERRLARWRDVAARLGPYHTDARGAVMLGEHLPCTGSHTHPAHLLWLYPLREKTWRDAGDREVMRRSLARWGGARQAWEGSSHVAAASLSAAVRAPRAALGHLRHVLSGTVTGDTQLTCNTLYRRGRASDAGVPAAAAQALLDLLVHAHNGLIEVFPAVPPEWPAVSVAGLRTDGGFLVDAVRSRGSTAWLRVRSESGGPLTVRHGMTGAMDVRDERGRRLPWLALDRVTAAIPLRKGECALISQRHGSPYAGVQDVADTGPAIRWGMPA